MEHFTNGQASLEQVQEWLKDHIGKGAPCPACHQLVKLYKRRLNAAMAYVLSLIYKWDRGKTAGGLPNPEWLHVPSYIAEQAAGNARRAAAVRGDWAKLKHWGLLEEQPGKREDKSKRVGCYRITTRGIDFVQGKTKVQPYIYIYNEVMIEKLVMERVSFRECLGKKFNFEELMKDSL